MANDTHFEREFESKHVRVCEHCVRIVVHDIKKENAMDDSVEWDNLKTDNKELLLANVQKRHLKYLTHRITHGINKQCFICSTCKLGEN